MNKPNILLITTDTQRWDSLKCMGSDFAVSPNLDRLASEGVLFMQAHTTSPVCSPARSSLMTGVHPPIHGCLENGLQRRNHLPMLTDGLKERGYRTIMVGKMHFGEVPKSFDVVHWATEKFTPADDAYGKHIRAHGYDRVSRFPNPVPEDLFMDAFLADLTIREIEAAVEAGSEPFFAFCSLVSPHATIDPPGAWAELYNDVVLPEINFIAGETGRHPEHLKKLLGLDDPAHVVSAKGSPDSIDDLEHAFLGDSYEEEDWNRIREAIDRLRRLYYGLCSYCDAQVGRLLDFLERRGLRENTLVLFTSDHGQQYYNHGFNDKHNYYDDTWRVPFIMSLPGVLPAGERREFAMWHDIAPTLLAAAGTECPSMQGFDLWTPLVEGGDMPRAVAVAALFRSAALATSRWKLEYYPDEGRGRLFDRQRDPLEREDLYASEKHAGLRNELLEALLAWRAGLSDLSELNASLNGGGPVARRVGAWVRGMQGTDVELQLNERVATIEERWNRQL